MADTNVEKDAHSTGADIHDYGHNNNNLTTTNTNNGNLTNAQAAEAHNARIWHQNPLAHVHSSDETRLPAFGGEFQPGLYKAIVDRRIANPAPLGLCAFALTTFVLSAVNLDTRGVNIPNIVVPLAFGYGGIVQLLAGMW